MIIHSDWHMHCEASYDSKLPISEIVETSRSFGFNKSGITAVFLSLCYAVERKSGFT